MSKRIEAIAKEQAEEIIKLIKKYFIKKGHAYYYLDTEELSLIDDGDCIKGDCTSYKTKEKTFKILLPPHLRKFFKTLEWNGVCQLPEDKIGQVVICLKHFVFPHQKVYLRTGKLPKDATLLGRNRSLQIFQEGQPIPAPEDPKVSGTGRQAYRGYRISLNRGLINTDWAKKDKKLNPRRQATSLRTASPSPATSWKTESLGPATSLKSERPDASPDRFPRRRQATSLKTERPEPSLNSFHQSLGRAASLKIESPVASLDRFPQSQGPTTSLKPERPDPSPDRSPRSPSPPNSSRTLSPATSPLPKTSIGDKRKRPTSSGIAKAAKKRRYIHKITVY
jgi:hypothetical protein